MDQYNISTVHLSVYRVAYCFVIAFIIGLPSFSWLSSDFDLFFDPPHASVAGLIGHFPKHSFFVMLTILNLFFFTGMFLGFSTKISSILFSITAIIGHNFWYSFGKVDHLLLWLLAPIFMSLAGWGEHISIHKKQELSKQVDNSLYILLFAICIAFSMFTSAVQKAWGGWLSWHTEAVRYHLIKNYFSLDRGDLLAPFFLHVKNHLLWKFFDYSALILEFGFLPSLFRKRYFQTFLAGGVLFHILVLLMFNIPFYSNLLAYIVFVNWSSINKLFNTKRFKLRLHLSQIYGILFCFGGVMGIFWIIYQINNQRIFRLPSVVDLFRGVQQAPSNLSMYILFGLAFLILLICIIAFINEKFHEKRLRES